MKKTLSLFFVCLLLSESLLACFDSDTLEQTKTVEGLSSIPLDITGDTPWFMGDRPITYCIDHGGDSRFSLTKEESVLLTKKIVEDFFFQIRQQYSQTFDFNYLSKVYWAEYSDGSRALESFSSNVGLDPQIDPIVLSGKVHYQEVCNDPDLQIILGNTDNPYIKKVVNSVSKERFKRFAGFTNLNEYDEANLRGKGFIYIAADRGDYEYSGLRNNISPFRDIWGLPKYFKNKKIGTNAVPEALRDFIKWNIFDNSTSAFAFVLMHELGHVIGIPHTPLINFMEVDSPTRFIRKGLILKNRFNHDLGFFTDLTLGFQNRIEVNGVALNELNEYSQDFYQIRFQLEEIFQEDDVDSQLAIGSADYYVQIRNPKFIGDHEKEEVVKVRFYNCYPKVSALLPSINLIYRSTNMVGNAFFDMELNQWVEEEPIPLLLPTSISLANFANRALCGEIYNSKLGFEAITLHRNFGIDFQSSMGVELFKSNGEMITINHFDYVMKDF